MHATRFRFALRGVFQPVRGAELSPSPARLDSVASLLIPIIAFSYHDIRSYRLHPAYFCTCAGSFTRMCRFTHTLAWTARLVKDFSGACRRPVIMSPCKRSEKMSPPPVGIRLDPEGSGSTLPSPGAGEGSKILVTSPDRRYCASPLALGKCHYERS